MSDLSHLALPGATFAVRVAPAARRTGLEMAAGMTRISVTAPPEDGKATEAARAALAKALGVAKTQLTLVWGATSRDKVFRLEDQPGATRSSR